MKKTVTIGDLAALAGVSKGTVSRVLNYQEGVGSETRLRIQKLIQDKAFTPRSAAQQLAKSRALTLGAVIPEEFHTSGFYWSEAISNLSKAAKTRGYALTLHPTDIHTPPDELNRLAAAGRVDGLILFGDPLQDPLARLTGTARIPAVVIGDPGKTGLSSVDIDNREGGRMMARWHTATGAARILFIAGPRENSSVQRRVLGYEEESAGKLDVMTVHLAYTAGSFSAIGELLKNETCDGIAVSSGDFVPGLVQHLIEQRKHLPVAFFDDMGILPLFEQSVRNHMVVRQNIQKTAETAVNTLLELIGGTGKPQHHLIPVRTEVREHLTIQ
ncbi:MAG: LacI family DNA-binding transcriptional regulator [Spirochaetales bacterium]|nr:LacI family DNA-binding transcriptional regulator [Spirochaetales bacterium]